MLASLVLSVITGVSALVHNPRTPVIVDRPYNIVSEVNIPLKEAVEADGVIELALEDIPRKAVRSVRLMYTGTAKPLVSGTGSAVFRQHFNQWAGGWSLWHDPEYSLELARCRPGKDGPVLLRFHHRLVADDNYFYVSLELDSRKMDISESFLCEVRSACLDAGEGMQPLEVRQDGFPRRYAGVAVRNHLDDGVDSYRIPGLVRTGKGTLVAVYDIRQDSSFDLNGDIDIGVSRSTDGGRTWEKMRVAIDMGEAGGLPKGQNGVGDPCILVDDGTGDLFIAGLWAHGRGGGTAIFTSRTGMDPIDVSQMVLVRSTDDGKTWSAPENITPQVKEPGESCCFQGPGAGITMKDGTLVIPCQWWSADKVPSAGIIYSRDHGKTWKRSRQGVLHTCEAQVAETTEGTLMLNMRNYGTPDHARKVFTTGDMGDSWQPHPSNGTLQEPVCQASLLKIPAGDNILGVDLLFFSNPASDPGTRNRITLRASTDLGLGWPFALMLDEEHGWGYSCIAPVDKETVGILYESGSAQLVFQKIKIKDIVKPQTN